MQNSSEQKPSSIMEVQISNYSVANWEMFLKHLKAQWPDDLLVEVRPSPYSTGFFHVDIPKYPLSAMDIAWFEKMKQRNIITMFHPTV